MRINYLVQQVIRKIFRLQFYILEIFKYCFCKFLLLFVCREMLGFKYEPSS